MGLNEGLFLLPCGDAGGVVVDSRSCASKAKKFSLLRREALVPSGAATIAQRFFLGGP